MWKPQIFGSIVLLGMIAAMAMFLKVEYGEVVVGGCVTGIGMLGMKLAEK